MRKYYLLALSALLSLSVFSFPVTEPMVKQTTIDTVSVNLRTSNAVVLSMLVFDAPEAGQVSLRFDGYCVSDSGDRIIVAASDIPDWGLNDGSVGVQASHPNNKKRAFSHTRVYDVQTGLDTFYAVAQNSVDENGSGVASVFGHLTLEYFPQSGTAQLLGSNINYLGDVRASQKIVQKVYSPTIGAGKVFVHIDGQVISDAGDQIVLSAANVPSWIVGDGSVTIKAFNNNQRVSPYSHSRVYNASSVDTLYAVVRNVVGQLGSGSANILGNLSGEYFPSTGLAQMSVREIEKSDMHVRAAAVAFDSITITSATDGFALAQLDGYCTSQLGDQILFAVSDDHNWGAGSNCVAMSAAYQTNKFNTISHSRLFPFTAGTHTYYCVSQNYGDVSGDGLVDVMANFTVKYFATVSVDVQETVNPRSFCVYPNPASDELFISLPENFGHQVLSVIDITGRVLQQIETGNQQQISIPISELPAGLLFIQGAGHTLKIVKQ